MFKDSVDSWLQQWRRNTDYQLAFDVFGFGVFTFVPSLDVVGLVESLLLGVLGRLQLTQHGDQSLS